MHRLIPPPISLSQAKRRYVCRICQSNGTPAPGNPMVYNCGEEFAHQLCLENEIRELDWYRRRVQLLEQYKHLFREPEQTLLCDILANGKLMPDHDGKRSTYASSPARYDTCPDQKQKRRLS